ncbi:hypothetical protein ACLOJK_004265 [Asimina triloba]
MDSKYGNCGSNTPPVQETDDPQTCSYSFGFSSINPASNTSKDGLSKPSLPTRPPIRLSEKSHHLCTENLGCETGITDVFDENFPSFSLANSRSKPPLNKVEKKQQKNEFPPPLKTMVGSNRIRLQRQREDGRLVLKAVPIPPSCFSFQATRSDGRLRLQFLGSAKKTELKVEEKKKRLKIWKEKQNQ